MPINSSLYSCVKSDHEKYVCYVYVYCVAGHCTHSRQMGQELSLGSRLLHTSNQVLTIACSDETPHLCTPT